ncbi:hypothetical protein FOZ60_011544 [Perkinsus olseni]|uniref:Retropepsins domain-containing protein n=2 Tax=Perkinsus olseni TaxID=32597 RepID=A0A7J6NDC4_PEROL|nr:hypothetical protein FOZ60_011544 [Perkinsus olseni]
MTTTDRCYGCGHRRCQNPITVKDFDTMQNVIRTLKPEKNFEGAKDDRSGTTWVAQMHHETEGHPDVVRYLWLKRYTSAKVWKEVTGGMIPPTRCYQAYERQVKKIIKQLRKTFDTDEHLHKTERTFNNCAQGKGSVYDFVEHLEDLSTELYHLGSPVLEYKLKWKLYNGLNNNELRLRVNDHLDDKEVSYAEFKEVVLRQHRRMTNAPDRKDDGERDGTSRRDGSQGSYGRRYSPNDRRPWQRQPYRKREDFIHSVERADDDYTTDGSRAIDYTVTDVTKNSKSKSSSSRRTPTPRLTSSVDMIIDAGRGQVQQPRHVHTTTTSPRLQTTSYSAPMMMVIGNVKVEGTVTPALFDTGAEVSLITESALRRQAPDAIVTSSITRHIAVADGGALQVNGTARLTVSTDKIAIDDEFIVITDDLSVPVLLGCPTLGKLKTTIQINPEGMHVITNDEHDFSPYEPEKMDKYTTTLPNGMLEDIICSDANIYPQDSFLGRTDCNHSGKDPTTNFMRFEDCPMHVALARFTQIAPPISKHGTPEDLARGEARLYTKRLSRRVCEAVSVAIPAVGECLVRAEYEALKVMSWHVVV